MTTSDIKWIELSGYLSLVWTKSITLTNPNSLDSDASCYSNTNFTVTPNHEIQCHGSRSCDSITTMSDISNNIQVYGAFSLVNGNFYTPGNGDSVVFYLYGYYTRYDATIYRLANDNCSTECGTNGCKNLNFLCDESVATCSVNCDESQNITWPNNWSNNNYSNSTV